jgi:nicotinic acid phosphoribosyltransferase
VFEPDFIRPFYKSKVATDAHLLEEVMQDGNASFASKVCEQGKRAGVNEEAHLDAVASLIVGGGLKFTSNDAACLVYPQVLTGGTTAHRFYASYPSEDEAMREAVENTERIALLTDFVETRSGLEKVLDLKEEFRDTGKVIIPRLDSGDIPTLTVEALQMQKERGMLDSKRDTVTVSEGLSSIEAVRALEEKVKKAGFSTELLKYGIGGLLVSKDKTRDSVSGAYKLTDTEF